MPTPTPVIRPAAGPSLAIAAVVVMVTGLAGSARSDCFYLPDFATSTAYIEYSGSASIWILPDGTGRGLDEAYAEDGQAVSAVITVQLIDTMGNPMTTIEPDEVWIQASPGSVAFCSGAWYPDAWDLANGLFYWTETPAGGGNRTQGDAQLEVRVCNEPLMPWSLTGLAINSPDINGDLQVDLSDIAAFVQDLGGPYHHRSDFVRDGVINLSDVTVMAAALGTSCR